MGFIIVLILVGLVLIFAEILLVPGVGIAGVSDFCPWEDHVSMLSWR